MPPPVSLRKSADLWDSTRNGTGYVPTKEVLSDVLALSCFPISCSGSPAAVQQAVLPEEVSVTGRDKSRINPLALGLGQSRTRHQYRSLESSVGKRELADHLGGIMA